MEDPIIRIAVLLISIFLVLGVGVIVFLYLLNKVANRLTEENKSDVKSFIKRIFINDIRQAEINTLNHERAVAEINSKIRSISFQEQKTLVEIDKLKSEININLLKEKIDAVRILSEKEVEYLKAQAEINKLRALTEQEFKKAELMQMAIDNIDKFPPSLQTYIYRAVFNPQDKQEDDILLQDEVRDYLKKEKESTAKKADAEAEKTKAQAQQEWQKADHEKWKHERQRKNDL